MLVYETLRQTQILLGVKLLDFDSRINPEIQWMSFARERVLRTGTA